MKDVRAIFMDQNPGFIVMITRVTADIRALITQNHFLV
jgi:hypothetical protein